MLAPRDVDLILEPEWIIPICPKGVVLDNHALVIDQGRIVALLPSVEAKTTYKAKAAKKLPGHILLPGLVNLHCHAAMTLLRGYADDLSLRRWLEERIWPAEAKHAGPDFVRTGSLLACYEMLRGGITCFNDMYFYPEQTAEAVLQSGIRASLGMIVVDFPTPYAADVDTYLANGIAVRDRYSNDHTLQFSLAPHAPYTVSDDTFERVVTLAAQIDVPIHIHAHETDSEITAESLRHGQRPLARLDRLGLLGPQTTLAHGVHLTPGELEIIGNTATNLAHCPTSNLKLGSGIAATREWMRRKINFGLGTDGAASNNRLDLWQEMRLASLMAKGSSGDAATFDCHQALHAATLGGAKALGLDEEIGSLEPGKSADMIAVRIDEWINQPCFDPASHLLYVTGREHVSHVWVNGKPLVSEGLLLSHDILNLLQETRLWHTRISEKT